MQLDSVRRDPFLTFLVIEKPNAGYLHRHVHSLKISRRGESRVELLARVGNAGGKSTARTHAIWIRNLYDHRAARAVGDHHVIIGIVSVDKLNQSRVDDPHRRLGGSDSFVAGNRAGRGD